MSALDKFTKQYPIRVDLPVQWGDMDAFNHVNNAAYFKYFESARIVYFEALGVMGPDVSGAIAPILAETHCRYRLPLYYPDKIMAGARVSEEHSHGFQMEYAIFSHHQQKVTAIGGGRIVMLNYESHEKVAVDQALANKIAEIEANP